MRGVSLICTCGYRQSLKEATWPYEWRQWICPRCDEPSGWLTAEPPLPGKTYSGVKYG